jgi:hypothetical protein
MVSRDCVYRDIETRSTQFTGEELQVKFLLIFAR